MEPALSGLIISLILCAVLNGFFVSARTAYASVRRQSLKDESDDGSRSARLALEIAEDSQRFLSTFSLASVLTSFIIAGTSTMLFIRVFPWLQTETGDIKPLLIVVILLFFALVVYSLTVQLPDNVVQRAPLTWAKTLARPAQISLLVLIPVVGVVDLIRKGFDLILGGSSESPTTFSEEELMTVVDASEEEGAIDLQEKEMIYKVLQLDETLAREIMIPRIDVIAVDISVPLEEARKLFVEKGHSRIPVYDDNLDHIKGLLYAKDLLEIEAITDNGLSSLLREPVFFPETKKASELLKELQASNIHMAIIVDEYGGTAGLVTIEDIVEEIVGEIRDEYDDEEEELYKILNDEEFIVDARIDLDDFSRIFEMEVPTEHGEETLGGFIYAQLGKVPDPDEVIETKIMTIKVLEVIDQRIRRVHITRNEPDNESEESNDKQEVNGHSSNGH